MRLRRLHLLVLLLLGVALALVPALADSATTANVEAINEGGGIYGETHRWSPAQVAVTPSTGPGTGSVAFANSSATVPHGIIWSGGPATPSCEEGAGKVPVGVGHSGTSWHGACAFTQEGVYTYYCSVHGRAMSGTVYVNASGTIPPTATTDPATALSETEATLNGTVDPKGQVTTYFFEYGHTTAYGQETSEASAGSGSAPLAVSAHLGGLEAGTTYHFQLVAKYASGASTVLGGDRSFIAQTPPPPPPPEEEHTTTTTTTSSSTSTSTTSLSTTTTTTTTASTAPPPSGPPGPSVPVGSAAAAHAIALAATQHGSAVHGSLEVSPSGVGGHMEIDLFASSAALARAHSHALRVGRLVRAHLRAGRLSFAVPLSASAARVLHRRHRLAVTVRIVVSPPHGAALSTTRSVTLRG